MPQMTDFLKLKPGVNELENKQSDAIRFKFERNCFGMIRLGGQDVLVVQLVGLLTIRQ